MHHTTVFHLRDKGGDDSDLHGDSLVVAKIRM
jgi:hypothetical protein